MVFGTGAFQCPTTKEHRSCRTSALACPKVWKESRGCLARVTAARSTSSRARRNEPKKTAAKSARALRSDIASRHDGRKVPGRDQAIGAPQMTCGASTTVAQLPSRGYRGRTCPRCKSIAMRLSFECDDASGRMIARTMHGAVMHRPQALARCRHFSVSHRHPPLRINHR